MRGVSRASLATVRGALLRRTSDGSPDALRTITAELFSVVHLLSAEARLRRLASDPAVDPGPRAGLLGELLGDKVGEGTRAVVDDVVRASWSEPNDLVDALDELAADLLFEAEERVGSLDDVEDELFRFGRILAREPALRAALTDPALPDERKRLVLDKLLDGRTRSATGTLVSEVALHPRGRTLDRGLEEYGRLAAARRERRVARVRTVVALTDDQRRRLSDALAAQLGHQVHLNVELDPGLVGGITVRVGDELYDGSIAHRLSVARRLMTR
jgi:F-type H+-transporting ATPase subunit delta